MTRKHAVIHAKYRVLRQHVARRILISYAVSLTLLVERELRVVVLADMKPDERGGILLATNMCLNLRLMTPEAVLGR